MTFNERRANYLVHRQHKYIKKIGTRYFYTADELKAFYNKTKDRATGEDKARAELAKVDGERRDIKSLNKDIAITTAKNNSLIKKGIGVHESYGKERELRDEKHAKERKISAAEAKANRARNESLVGRAKSKIVRATNGITGEADAQKYEQDARAYRNAASKYKDNSDDIKWERQVYSDAKFYDKNHPNGVPNEDVKEYNDLIREENKYIAKEDAKKGMYDMKALQAERKAKEARDNSALGKTKKAANNASKKVESFMDKNFGQTSQKKKKKSKINTSK